MTYVDAPGQEIPVGMTDAEVQAQALRAAKAFRKMIPTLTSFARILTRKRDVRIIADGSNPRTDGKNIYMRPLFGLGKVFKHDRKLCDRRDSMLIQLCEACRQHEFIMAALYHEIGHIAHGSFESTTTGAIEHAINRAIDERDNKYAEYQRKRIESAPFQIKQDYIGLANLISPWLGLLVNALEDTRINQASHQARPGVRKMLEALNRWCLSEIQHDNQGNEVSWRTRPLNMQAIMVAFCMASELKNVEIFFGPEVQHLFHDPELQQILKGASTVRSAHATYYLSFLVLDRLREHGFCLRPYEPMPEQPDDQSGEGDGEGDDEQSKMDSSEMEGDSSDSDTSDSRGEGSESEDDQVSEMGGSSEEGTQSEASSSGNVGEPEDDNQDNSDDTGSDPSTSQKEEVDDDEPEDESSMDGEEPGSSEEDVSRDESVEEDEDSPDPGSQTGTERHDDTAPSEDEIEVDSERSSDPIDGESSDADSSESSDDIIDTGEDQDIGGIPADYDDRYGTPEEAEQEIAKVLQHEETMTPEMVEAGAKISEVEKAIDVAVIKGLYFEKPPAQVEGIRIHTTDNQILFPDGTSAAEAFTGRLWSDGGLSNREHYGIDCDTDIPESILGPALLKMRKVLADNQRTGHQRNMKSGKIRGAVLGRRGFNPDDERLFQKKRIPKKKNYAVLIGLDVSGSTQGMNLALTKRAAMAQAELCSRTGVAFSIWAHSGKINYGHGYPQPLNFHWAEMGYTLDFYVIKGWNDPWDKRHQEVLSTLACDSDNLDGHSMEFYRKELDKVQATDKILMYYTDGKMPAANYDEELEVLHRELKTCKHKGYIVPGIGIRTNSPTAHGLDTVRVDTDEDLIKVVHHLEKLIRS